MLEAESMDPSLAVAGRILGALVFGWSVLGKVRHYDEFVGVVANYRLLPAAAAIPIARLLVALEILVAAGLATPWLTLPAALTALVLLAVFTVAMGVNLARGRREIDCGCFQSSLRQQLRPALLLRNLVLMLALTPALFETGADTGSALQWVDGIGAGLVGFILYQAVGQLLALGAPRRAVRRS